MAWEPDGRPLVLLHGMSSGGFAWAPVLPALQAAGRKVVVLDLPGHEHGRPIDDEATFSMETMVSEVAEELDRLGIASADLVGNSLGGWIALRLAAQGRATSVVCLAPAGGWVSGSAYDRWLRAQFRVGRLAAVRLTGGRLSPLLRFAATRDALLAGMVSRPGNLSPRAGIRAIRAVAECDALRVLLRRPSAARLGYPGPPGCAVLVAWSEQDRILVSRRARRTFMSWLPDASETTLEGVGHVPMSDDPALVAEVILDFTASVAVAVAS